MDAPQTPEKPKTASECCRRAETLWFSEEPSPEDRRQALELWLHAVTNFNHARSARNAAAAFHFGAQGIQKDPSRAITLYEVAVAAGDCEAMTKLASLLMHGEGVARNAVRAKELYERAAGFHDIHAMRRLGVLLYIGARGVPRDTARAKDLFERATAAGDIVATNNLGMVLWKGGEGVTRDTVRAKDLFERAAAAGDVVAANNLGMLLWKGGEGVTRDTARAKEFLERAAAAGDIDATYKLGMLLWKGGEGVTQDTARAKEFLERAAAAGDIHATNNLGMLLWKGGEGVARNTARAQELFVHAGRLRHAERKASSNHCSDKVSFWKATDAKEYFELAVGAGDASAMTNLAILLQNGAEGIARDFARAKELYECAADAGDIVAMTNLGRILESGTEEVTRDVVRAKELYERAVCAGSDLAMVYLGLLLQDGAEDVAQDAARSKELYERAVSAGNVLAMTNLGNLLCRGAKGVARDAVRAKELYERAVSAEDSNAMTNLGILLKNGAEGVPKDAARAKEIYERAVSVGNVRATVNLAVLLRDGAEGVPQDAVRAKELYERAVSAGDLDAMRNLGILLKNGAKGVDRDAVRAKELCERAASADDPGAMFTLAQLLWRGAQGVEKDAVRAKELYERAASAGHVGAVISLANLLKRGATGIERDFVRAKELYERAARAGYVNAMTNLGALLQCGGKGVARDVLRAKGLYERAARAGDVTAMRKLGKLLMYGAEGIKPDPLRAKKLHDKARRDPSWRGLLFRAQFLSTGGEDARKDVFLATQCYEKAVKAATIPAEEAMARTEFARFLLAQDGKELHENTQKAIDLLEKAVEMWPYRETLSELFNLYSHATAAEFRNPQRAAQLKQVVPSDGYQFFKGGIVAYLEEDDDAEKRLIAVMQNAVVRPKSCLLLIMGEPARGKTATLNSLRGLPFVSQHLPTEMAEMNQFVTEPGVRGLDDGMLDDLDFRENSFRGVASRIYARDVARYEKDMIEHSSGTVSQPPRRLTATDEHRDVLERVRQSLTHSPIDSKKSSMFARCWDLGGQNHYEMAHSLFIARADMLIFVVNLERVRNESTRNEEIRGLCYWMQLSYMLIQDPSHVRVIIVGTHKGQERDDSASLKLLLKSLGAHLGQNVYDEWVREQPCGISSIFVGIENSQALEDPKGSGLENLETHLRKCLESVLESRKSIPVRWIALVDKLRRIQGEKRVLWSRQEVEEVCKQFPGFSLNDSERSKELLRALNTMTTMTGIASTVLFELNRDEWVLSVSPDRLIEMFRRITGTSEWEKRLTKEEIQKLDRSGTLSENTLLSQVWGADYEEVEKRKMADLLCKCDLLVRLRNEYHPNGKKSPLYGVPFLFKSNRTFLKWKGEKERLLEVVTEFRDALPNGLQGGLTAHLSRTVHDGLQEVEMVGRNAALLVLRARGRVIVEYNPADREIVWTCIGRDPVKLAQLCVKSLDSFLNHRAHRVRVQRNNVVRVGCNRKDGCGKRAGIQMDISILFSNSFDQEMLCSECRVPRKVSKLFGDLDTIDDTFPGLPRAQHSELDPAELLEHAHTRMSSARYYFGDLAIEEACKGLSRLIEVDNEDDIECFGHQLRTINKDACETNYVKSYAEKVPCFAISYVQHTPKQGRFKFSDDQWENLRYIFETLSTCGLKKCRVWLDQCLWLRDAQQRCWAQTGVLPYLLWPVISLGNKKFGGDRTQATYERVWPFVEEVMGLWSLGTITASEERGPRREDGCRRWITFNHRRRLEPEKTMRLFLLNIYHGAIDNLKTGWTEDLRELKEMARWNIESASEKLIVGANWKLRLASRHVKSHPKMLLGMALQRQNDERRGEHLDATIKLEGRKWNGFAEWMSGNKPSCDMNDSESQGNDLMARMTKINVITNVGEFQLLGLKKNSDEALWLLVAMDGRSSNFSHGKVKWTTVVHGESSCLLQRSSTSRVIELVLREQLGNGHIDLNINSVEDCTSKPIEWI